MRCGACTDVIGVITSARTCEVHGLILFERSRARIQLASSMASVVASTFTPAGARCRTKSYSRNCGHPSPLRIHGRSGIVLEARAQMVFAGRALFSPDRRSHFSKPLPVDGSLPRGTHAVGRPSGARSCYSFSDCFVRTRPARAHARPEITPRFSRDTRCCARVGFNLGAVQRVPSRVIAFGAQA